MEDFQIDGINAVNFINLNNDELLKILEMRNDARIAKWMLLERQISQNEHFNFVEKLKTQKNQVYFALKNNINEILGVISLNNIDLHNKNAFIGIYANPNKLHLRGDKNIGQKIMKVLKYISFDELSLHIIFVKCLSTNTLALRFYEKEGFFQCGILPQSIKKTDKFIDTIILAFKKD